MSGSGDTEGSSAGHRGCDVMSRSSGALSAETSASGTPLETSIAAPAVEATGESESWVDEEEEEEEEEDSMGEDASDYDEGMDDEEMYDDEYIPEPQDYYEYGIGEDDDVDYGEDDEEDDEDEDDYQDMEDEATRIGFLEAVEDLASLAQGQVVAGAADGAQAETDPSPPGSYAAAQGHEAATATAAAPVVPQEAQAQARRDMQSRVVSMARIRQLLAGGRQTAQARQLLRHLGLQIEGAGDEEEEEDEEDDDDESEDYSRHSLRRSRAFQPAKEPHPRGVELMQSGQFGPVYHQSRDSRMRPLEAKRCSLGTCLRNREKGIRGLRKSDVTSYMVPDDSGEIVGIYKARVYSGQYSVDASFFYTCSQDFRLHIYDTRGGTRKESVSASGQDDWVDEDDSPMPYRRRGFTSMASSTGRRFQDGQISALRKIKTIHGHSGRWTITDANLSPDNTKLIYSSITPIVHLCNVQRGSDGSDEMSDDVQQTSVDFGMGSWNEFGIWSIRFSADGREIVAGASDGEMFVYDVEADRRTLKLPGHEDDTNAVCFADVASNILLSGSDDGIIKIWDRRSLRGKKASGAFVGHVEGITYVDAKGDGRYVLSNGKDQSMKLWDLRKMMPAETFEALPRKNFTSGRFDYRSGDYTPRKRPGQMPEDTSVMTYHGHAVLKTLIRCHFSPEETTGGRYVYSGSADGRIHIWNIDGTVAQIIDRHDSRLAPELGGPAALPGAPGGQRDPLHRGVRRGAMGNVAPDVSWSTYGMTPSITVRDVSWNPVRPELISTAWDGEQAMEGSIACHQWVG